MFRVILMTIHFVCTHCKFICEYKKKKPVAVRQCEKCWKVILNESFMRIIFKTDTKVFSATHSSWCQNMLCIDGQIYILNLKGVRKHV